MTKDYSPQDWDYEKLQAVIQMLERERRNAFYEKDKRAIQHAIEFIEFNIEAGDIKSPLQTYLTEK